MSIIRSKSPDFVRFWLLFCVFLRVLGCFCVVFCALEREKAVPWIVLLDWRFTLHEICFMICTELWTANYQRLPSDKLANILTYRRTPVNKKWPKTVKISLFSFLVILSAVEGPLIQFLAALSAVEWVYKNTLFLTRYASRFTRYEMWATEHLARPPAAAKLKD